jgi:hypothetical protein
MLDAGKDAAPVPAIESPVNNPSDFHINSISGQNFVIYPTQQIEEPALLSSIRIY